MVMASRSRFGLAVCLGLVVLSSGCGDGGLSDKERTDQARALAGAVRSHQAAHAEAAAHAAQGRCQRQLARLNATVENVQTYVDAHQTINFDEYSARTASLARELDRMQVVGLSDSCLAVASQLESAAITHDQVTASWGLCLKEIGAGVDVAACGKPLDKLLQAGWRKATTAYRTAERRLRGLGTPQRVRLAGLHVPENASDVEASVYGQAVRVFCGRSPKLAATEACATLRRVLIAGITTDELDDLDGATADLLEAEGLVVR